VGYAERALLANAQVMLVTAAASGPIADRAACSVHIPAPSKLDQHEVISMQPMGSLFEAALGILLDTVVIQVMREKRLTAEQLYARHANLE
jgi:6-phospho-3-hexuloisomerase